MYTILWILLATLLDTALAFSGILAILWNRKRVHSIVFFLVALSAGTLLGGAFFHLIPESIEAMSPIVLSSILMLGFVVFYVAERFLFWHHCHEGECKVHPFTHLILWGDAVHNFIDGIVIAGSFIVSVPFGIVTSILIFSHEIPQELGDFGVLIHGGMKVKRALILNALSQATCVIGGVLGYFFAQYTAFSIYLLPFAAGGFIYIAASDLIPELHKEPNKLKSMGSLLMFLIGLGFVLLFKLIFHS
jgi:zinc and cadmium transporter